MMAYDPRSTGTNIAPFLDKKDVAQLKMIKLLTDRT